MGLSGRNLLNTLVVNGCIASGNVISAIGNRIKKPLDEIEACVCGRLNPYECKLLAHILKKLDDAQRDVDCILNDMEQLAAPYAKALEQCDSIPGIDITAALAILAEISPTPQDNFESSAKLCAWAGLSPRNDESAGKIKSRKIMHGSPYIKSVLCQVAWAAVRSRKSQLSIWFWSHQGKLGRKKAIIAVARKILALIYKLLKYDEFYDPNVALMAYSSPAE